MNQFTSMLPLLYFIGACAFGVGYLFIQAKTGGNKAGTDVLDWYKEQDKIKSEQIQTLQKDLGTVQGQLLEKDKQIKTLQETLSGRDPAQVEYMQQMQAVAEVATKFITTYDPVLRDLKLYLDKQKNMGTNKHK